MSPGKKHTLVIAAIIVLTVVAIGTLSIWILGSNQKPTTPPTLIISPSPSQTAASGPCKNFETFEYAKFPVSCKKAVELALAQSPGKVQKVSIGPIRAPIPLSSGGIERRTVDMWLIDIELDSPYFDENFEREIRMLQIGFRLDGESGIYKKPLE